MKKLTLLFAFFVLITHAHLNAQWQLTGNNNATNTSVLGTTNSIPLSIVTKNTTRLLIDTNGRVGIGTSTMPNIFSVKGTGSTPAASWVSSGAPLFTGFGEQTVGNADYILSILDTDSEKLFKPYIQKNYFSQSKNIIFSAQYHTRIDYDLACSYS